MDDLQVMFDRLSLEQKDVFFANNGAARVAAAAAPVPVLAPPTGWLYGYKLPVTVQVRPEQPELYYVKIGLVLPGNSLRGRIRQEMEIFQKGTLRGVDPPIPLATIDGAVDDNTFFTVCKALPTVCFFVRTDNPEPDERALLASIGNFVNSPKSCPKQALLQSLLGHYRADGFDADHNRPAMLWIDWLLQPDNLLKNTFAGHVGAKEWRIVRKTVFDAIRARWALAAVDAFSVPSIDNAVQGMETRFDGFVRLHRDRDGHKLPINIRVWPTSPSAALTKNSYAHARADADILNWPEI